MSGRSRKVAGSRTQPNPARPSQIAQPELLMNDQTNGETEPQAMTAAPAEPEGVHPLRILDEFRQRRRDFVRYLGPGMTVTIVAFLIALYFVEPSPPRELVIAAGQKDGQYYATALAYATVFERNGITLTVKETAGSLENFELLQDDESVTRGLFGLFRRRRKVRMRRVCEKNGMANVTYKNISERKRRYLTDIYTTLVDAG